MLELHNIVKIYPSGDENIRALKGINLTFRNCEFVSILGPSGCGKTTTLNIIGGLDHYTDGDLIINGCSTKKYKDRDWDSYRNHAIGFIFQSYNLIPHQTVLSNVELALTLSGVGKRERRARAKQALEAVGLGSQLKKRPAQMSGGQMQRVAIARAIVNNPDIILADEPTGALDSETSIQVMNILKEIAKDRLVIMVTHNPELAQQYSTRIIKMLDGQVMEDSMPITEAEYSSMQAEDAAKLKSGSIVSSSAKRANESYSTSAHSKKHKRSSMSFFTSFSLSLNNLFTKKGRTLLTSFAGSIGIIGIALIYAVSQGTSDYIDTVQEDTLSSYPLSITSEAADFSAILSNYVNASKASESTAADNQVVEKQVISSMLSGISKNDLSSLKTYFDQNYDLLINDVNAIQYSYNITPQIYTRDINGDILQANPSKLMSSMSVSSMSSYGYSLFSEMIDNQDMIVAQYDLLAGEWPDSYNELLLVLSDPNQISDILTYSIGLHDMNQLSAMLSDVLQGKTPDISSTPGVWSYNELLSLEFRLISKSSLYQYDTEHSIWSDYSTDSDYIEKIYSQAEPIKVVGIACAKSGATSSLLSSGFNYLPSLTLHVMKEAEESEIVQMQLANEEINVFSGKPFGEEDEDSGLDFSDMISVDEDALSSAFNISIDSDAITRILNNSLQSLLSNVSTDATTASAEFTQNFKDLGVQMLNNLADQSSDGTVTLNLNDSDSIAESFLKTESAQKTISSLASKYGYDEDRLQTVFKPLLSAMILNYVVSNSQTNDVISPDNDSDSTSDSDNNTNIDTESILDTETSDVDSNDVQFSEIPDDSSNSVADSDNAQSDSSDSSDPADSSDDNLPDISSLLDASAQYRREDVQSIVDEFSSSALVSSAGSAVGTALIVPSLRSKVTGAFSGIASQAMSELMGGMSVDEDAIANAFQFNMTESDMTRLITALSGSTSADSATENLRLLGYASENEPESISVYLKNFESKENFKNLLSDYNTQAEENGTPEKEIRYTDITGVLMSSVTTIINAITYVLIAFVAISLIVSSIMIGVITLISVQERTKEIGILRAIGASKKNVSQMFNAETLIIGFTSGIIGVGITYLLCIPINLILHKLTGISYLSANLPPIVAAALVVISMTLTLFAGIIPSHSASKKDPVVALRTE